VQTIRGYSEHTGISSIGIHDRAVVAPPGPFVIWFNRYLNW